MTLSVGSSGDGVARIHQDLTRLGFAIDAVERGEQRFGEVTRAAIRSFQRLRGLHASGTCDRATALLLSAAAQAAALPAASTVTGRVKRDDEPTAGLTVRAFDRGLRSEVLLGAAVTDDDGRYVIRYGAQQLRRPERNSADLVVRIFALDETEIGSAPTLFAAPMEATIDVKLVSAKAPGSEWHRLAAAIAPARDGVPLSDLSADDIAFLAHDVSIDQALIARLQKSAALARATGLPAELAYGLLAQGAPDEPKALLSMSADALQAKLAAAVAANQVAPSVLRTGPWLASQLSRARVAQGLSTRHQLIVRLLGQHNLPLVGYRVQLQALDGSALTAPATASSDGAGLALVRYAADAGVGESHALRLQIESPDGKLAQTVDLAVTRDDGAPIDVRLAVAASAPAALSLPASVVDAGFAGLADVAAAPAGAFVAATAPALGDLRAALTHATARAQSQLLDSYIARAAADHANGLALDDVSAQLSSEFEGRCSCPDCEAAVSPAAYLADLLDYALAHLQLAGRPIDIGVLVDRFHQPFGRLPMSCGAVEETVHQVRVCVEVLRDYLAANPPGAALADALAAALRGYLSDAYVVLLNRFGTSYDEIRRARTAADADRAALAARLGIDLTVPRGAGDQLDQLFLDPTAQPPDPTAPTESALERIFGLVDTTRDPLSDGLKLGDRVQSQFLHWTFDGVEWGRNCDAAGLLYAKLWSPAAGRFRVELYRDSARSAANLVAAGEGVQPNTTITLNAQGDSGLSGSVDIAYVSDDAGVSFSVVPLFTSWRMAHLRTLWTAQDFPRDAYDDSATPLLPVVDPDLIGPDDLRQPQAGDVAFDLWSKRRAVVDGWLASLASTRVAQGLTVAMQQALGPLPDLDALLAALTTGTADQVDAARQQILTLRLTVDSFVRLMALRATDQAAAADARNPPLTDEQWSEVYSILAQAQKQAQSSAWRAEERNANLALGPREFWSPALQPVGGDWPPLWPANTPFIDPDLLKLADLPEPTAGGRAIGFYQARRAQLQQQLAHLEQVRLASGFDGVTREALGQPNPGDPLPDDLTTLANDLASPDPAVVATATQKIETDLFLTIDQFNTVIAIKAKAYDPNPLNQPLASDWAQLESILNGAEKLKRLYPVWLAEEQSPSTGVVYWTALKARLPKWRASDDARQVWRAALELRSLPALIDPDLIFASDLRDPTSGAAYGLWQARDQWINDPTNGQLAILRAARQNAPAALAGFDEILLSAVGVDGATLAALNDQQAGGQNIGPRIAQLDLSSAAFAELVRIRSLAAATQPILPSEWEGVYSILVAVEKARASADWRTAEQAAGLALSPDFFQITPPPPPSYPPPPPLILPHWRATDDERQSWLDTLQSRIDQQSTSQNAAGAATFGAEETTLVELRDALVQACNLPPGASLADQATYLSDRFMIDVQAGACQTTTRVAQAIEALQNALFEARTGRHDNAYVNATSTNGHLPNVAAAARTSATRDVFVVDVNSSVYANTRDDAVENGIWRGWTQLQAPAGVVQQGMPLTLVAPSSTSLKLFVVGSDRAVYCNSGNSDAMGGFVALDMHSDPQTTITVPPFSSVAAVVRDATHVDVAVMAEWSTPLGPYGNVRRNTWDSAQGKWLDAWIGVDDSQSIETFPQAAPLTMVARASRLHLFAVGYTVRTTTGDPAATSWGDWIDIPNSAQLFFGPGPVAAVARDANTVDAFIVASTYQYQQTGAIYWATWNSGSNQWSNWQVVGNPNTDQVSMGAPITVVARDAHHLDLFVVGTDGGVWWNSGDGAGNWNGWTALGTPDSGDTVAQLSSVTAFGVDASHMEAFVIGGDGGVYVNRWTSFGWNGWQPIGSDALTLAADNFDEEWTWIGSYASWRAAMFVFLYPENILLPTLRTHRTPAFGDAIDDLRANNTPSPQDICTEAEKYSTYFHDVCTITVEASCQARTHIFANADDPCHRQDLGYRCLFYQFGRGGATNTVYMSVYDPQDGSGFAQSPWTPIQVDGFTGITQLVGATPYSIDDDHRYIFLFALNKDYNNDPQLVFIRYDLETLGWTWLTTIDLPWQDPQQQLVLAQRDDDAASPHLIFWSGGRVVERRLSFDGSGWEANGPFNVLSGDLFGIIGGGLLAALELGTGELYIVGQGELDNYYPAWSMVRLHPQQLDQYNTRYSFDVNNDWVDVPDVFRGAFIWPNSSDVFVLTGDDYNAPMSWLVVDAPSINLGPTTVPLTMAPLARLIPSSGPTDDPTGAKKRFAYVGRKDAPGNFRCQLWRRDTPELREAGRVRTTPLVAGPYDLTSQKPGPHLQVRRGLIQQAFAANADGDGALMMYLDEAFYSVPVYFALQLRQAGQYGTALDWFLNAYDYTAPEDRRKIYYGLVIEESLPDSYQRAVDWLLDPLNPHAIATTRQNTYTRFTLLSIVRCLLDYADSEFAQDSSESLPRARSLYQEALELLRSRVLNQSLDGCDQIIGVLTDTVGGVDDVRMLSRIRQQLGRASDPTQLQAAVTRIRQALEGSGAPSARLAQAWELAVAAGVAHAAPRLGVILQQRRALQTKLQQKLLADPSVAAAVQAVGAAAADELQRALRMVTGDDTKTLVRDGVPWLRGATTLSRGAKLGPTATLSRTDAGKYEPLAPTYAGTLALVAASDPTSALAAANRASTIRLPSLTYQFCIPPNPQLDALRLHCESDLYKLRTCRNLAGVKRSVDSYAAPTDTTTGMPTVGANGQLVIQTAAPIQPTPYRYSTLIERAKQLVQLASQFETSMLSAIEKADAESYTLLKARQDLGLTDAGVRLQDLRVSEANDAVKLAQLQQQKANIAATTYQEWLNEGLNQYEQEMLSDYADAASARMDAASADTAAQIAQALVTAAAASPTNAGPAAASAEAVAAAASLRLEANQRLIRADEASQVAALKASFERRQEEWQLQEALAQQDQAIGAQQVQIANDQVQVATQERSIAQLQASNARDTVQFLTNKFTNAELYEWMSDVLEGVYRFFLQQATSTARLAENQLSFERQQVSPTFIQADYWQSPDNGAQGQTVDRRGLTGSARLLEDITQLDQYAFDTDTRKLQLTKTISLAQLAPAEFRRFQETGVIAFATPMELFDRDFPGHYLRLIKRVRTSVIALVPPTDGIHATLSSGATSRVVIGGDTFTAQVIRRDPQYVALSSPLNATGLFDLDTQSDMLLPFEGCGVDTTWEFVMPRASNRFDFGGLADVLITIEYTALNSFDYRDQVLQSLKPTISSDRAFSLRADFSDAWYDLANPDQSATPMSVQWTTARTDFPPNLDDLRIQQVLLYFVGADGTTVELTATLRFTSNDASAGAVGGTATSVDGVISTRAGNAASWIAMIGKVPFGTWGLSLSNSDAVRSLFANRALDDILLVVTYQARTPPWPT